MLFLLISTSILILIYTYIGFRLIIPTKVSLFWKRILWALLIASVPLAPGYIILRKLGIPGLLHEVLPWVAYTSLGFFCLVFTFLIIRDAALFGSWILSFIHKIKGADTGLDSLQAPERRSFLIQSSNLGILGLSGIFSGHGIFETRHLPKIETISVPIQNLPENLEGFQIVQISDIHVSPTMRKGFVKDVVDQVNNLNPDVVVLTGDLADGPVSIFRNEVASLKKLSSQYGSYFVTGNHEYYAGAKAWIEEVERLGFNVLLNEHQIIKHKSENIILAGVTDFNAGRFSSRHVSDVGKAISGAPNSGVKILLAHQPRSIFAAAKAGFDLQISGHTHGGQFFPWQYFVYLQQPYVSGLHKHENTWIYVNRGTGYWGPPLRLGSPSEITSITLTLG